MQPKFKMQVAQLSISACLGRSEHPSCVRLTRLCLLTRSPLLWVSAAVVKELLSPAGAQGRAIRKQDSSFTEPTQDDYQQTKNMMANTYRMLVANTALALCLHCNLKVQG